MIIFFFFLLSKEKENYFKIFIVYFFINSIFKGAIIYMILNFQENLIILKKKDNVKTVYFTLLFFIF